MNVYDTPMSHKKHFSDAPTEYFFIPVLIISSFALALFILHSEFNNISGLTKIERGLVNTNQSITIPLNSFSVSGIQARVKIGEPDQVEALWEQFSSDSELHAGLDWNDQHTAIAIYHEIGSFFQTATLLIGYTTESFISPTKRSNIKLPQGQYRHYELSDTKNQTVMDVWKQIVKDTQPIFVIERYGLDSRGNTRRIQIQILGNL